MSRIGRDQSRVNLEVAILDAYETARSSGADEWKACDAALDTFMSWHPEASSEFANLTVARILSECAVGSPEWGRSGAGAIISKPIGWTTSS